MRSPRAARSDWVLILLESWRHYVHMAEEPHDAPEEGFSRSGQLDEVLSSPAPVPGASVLVRRV